MRTRAASARQEDGDSDGCPPPLPPQTSVKRLQKKLKRAVQEAKQRKSSLLIRIPRMPPNPLPTTVTSVSFIILSNL